MRIRIIHSDVKFIRIRFQSNLSGTATAFTYLQLAALVPLNWLPNAARTVQRSARRPLYQAAAPTEGLAYPGQRVGSFMCVARADTTLSAAAAASATSVTVTSATGMAVGDLIGILLTDGLTHWTTISAIAATSLTLTAAIPAAGAASGAAVATNRWQ